MSPELTPHDESFRKVFGDPELARQLIEHYLPDLVECPEEYRRYVPDFDYELLNCAAIPDERLAGNQPVGGVMMVYKHAFDEDFGQHLDRWLELIEDLFRAKTVGEQVFALLKYIGHLCDNVDGEEFRHKVIEAYEEKGDELMSSVADQWIERGKQIGRKEAIPDARRDDVLRVIEERFDQVPTTVTDLVSGVTDEDKLDAMLSAAARAQTVEQLDRMLREVREGA